MAEVVVPNLAPRNEVHVDKNYVRVVLAMASGANGTDGADAGAWDSSKTYSTGSIVSYNGSIYIALRETTNDTPGSSPLDWELATSGGGDVPDNVLLAFDQCDGDFYGWQGEPLPLNTLFSTDGLIYRVRQYYYLESIFDEDNDFVAIGSFNDINNDEDYRYAPVTFNSFTDGALNLTVNFPVPSWSPGDMSLFYKVYPEDGDFIISGEIAPVDAGNTGGEFTFDIPTDSDDIYNHDHLIIYVGCYVEDSDWLVYEVPIHIFSNRERLLKWYANEAEDDCAIEQMSRKPRFNGDSSFDVYFGDEFDVEYDEDDDQVNVSLKNGEFTKLLVVDDEADYNNQYRGQWLRPFTDLVSACGNYYYSEGSQEDWPYGYISDGNDRSIVALNPKWDYDDNSTPYAEIYGFNSSPVRVDGYVYMPQNFTPGQLWCHLYDKDDNFISSVLIQTSPNAGSGYPIPGTIDVDGLESGAYVRAGLSDDAGATLRDYADTLLFVNDGSRDIYCDLADWFYDEGLLKKVADPGDINASDVYIDPTYAGTSTGGFFTPSDDDVQAFNNKMIDGFIYLSSGLADLSQAIQAGASGLARSINKTGHGLSVGNIVRLEGGSESGSGQYVLSQADTEEHAQVDGMVLSVQDADNFVLFMSGYFPTGLSGMPGAQTGYLSPDTPGTLTFTKPSVPGQIIKPIFRAIGSTRGQFTIDIPGTVVDGVVDSTEPRDQLNVLLSLEDRERYALVGGGADYDGNGGFTIPNPGDFADGGVDIYNEFVPLWNEYSGDPEQWNFQEVFTIEDDAAWGGDLVETAICWKGRNPVPFLEVTAADSATENGSGNGYGEYPSTIWTQNEYNGEMWFLQRVRYTYNPSTGESTLYRPTVVGETPDDTAFGVDWKIASIITHQNPGSHPMASVDPSKPIKIGKGSGRFLVSRVTVNSFDGTPYCDFDPVANYVDENTVFDPVLNDNWTNVGAMDSRIVESSVVVGNLFNNSAFESVVAGNGISVDDTDPQNPEISWATTNRGLYDNFATYNAGDIVETTIAEHGIDGFYLAYYDNMTNVAPWINLGYGWLQINNPAAISIPYDPTVLDDESGGLFDGADVQTMVDQIGVALVNEVQTLQSGKEDVSNKSTSTSLGTSNTLYPSQNAVKTYVDNLIGANDAMVYKGVINASTNPNYPAADAGHTYKISVAGKIGGASGINVEVGDMLICLTDSTASGNQATVGSNWNIIQVNIDGAVIGPASSTSGNFTTFNGTSGKVVQDSGVSLDTDGTLAANSDSKLTSQKATKTYADAKVADAINDGTTTIAPSQNAVYDALALKLNSSAYDDADTSEVNSGTSTSKYVSPDSLAGSYAGSKPVAIQVFDSTVSTGDGKAYFRIPTSLNGMDLVSVGAAVITTSSSGNPTIQIARGRQSSPTSAHSYVDMLSTPITINATEYDSKDATAAAVINTSNDDVLTGDLIRIDVDVAGTGTQGLNLTLTFRLP